jgi:phosphate-selective porin OprO/OprP
VIAVLLTCLLAAGAAGGERGTQAQSPPGKQAPGSKAGKPAKAKKSKKPKKTKAPNEPADAGGNTAAPDEPLDSDTEANPPAPKSAPQFVWKQHPSIRFGKTLRLDFEAKFQNDARSSYDGAETNADLSTWELHRSRIGVLGTAFKHVDFEIERELQEKELSEKDILLGLTPAPQWKDVYVSVDYLKNVQIQGGKFKVPFGLDTTTGVTHNDFVYRSLGSIYLTPSRDVGLMAHGRFFKHGLNYWTGVFRHDGDNARSKKIQGGDGTFAARVTGLPLRRVSPEWLDGFALGTSFAVSKVSDDSFRPNGLRGRTVVTQDTFYEPVYVKGRRIRWAADLDWTIRAGSMRAEYTHVRDQRLSQGFGDEALPDGRYRAWYVSGTWLLTGEPKTRPVKAAEDFLQGGWGAVELAARMERAWFDSVDRSDEPFANPRAFTILSTGDKVLTLGVNWTLNRFVKVQVNAIREQVEDPGRNPVPNGAAFWSRVLRLQLVL